jgi:hypothetical protein
VANHTQAGFSTLAVYISMNTCSSTCFGVSGSAYWGPSLNGKEAIARVNHWAHFQATAIYHLY